MDCPQRCPPILNSWLLCGTKKGPSASSTLPAYIQHFHRVIWIQPCNKIKTQVIVNRLVDVARTCVSQHAEHSEEVGRYTSLCQAPRCVCVCVCTNTHNNHTVKSHSVCVYMYNYMISQSLHACCMHASLLSASVAQIVYINTHSRLYLDLSCV